MPIEKVVSVGLQSFSFIDQRMSVNERCRGKKPPSRKFSCFVIHKVI